jgi:hypothetical protein
LDEEDRNYILSNKRVLNQGGIEFDLGEIPINLIAVSSCGENPNQAWDDILGWYTLFRHEKRSL